jgi:hypothetical protein
MNCIPSLTWRVEKMRNPFDYSEVDAAADDLCKAVDRLVDLGFDWEPIRALRADAALRDIRYLVTDAIVSAFPRAGDPFERGRLIGLIGAMSPRGHDEALTLLERLADEDPDEDGRLHAEEVLYNMTDRDSLEANLTDPLVAGSA